MTARFIHVTTRTNLASIAAEGLRAGAYLIDLAFDDVKAIRDYYAEVVVDDGDEPVVVTVDASGIDESKLRPDHPGIQEPLTRVLGMSEKTVWSRWEASDQTWADCLAIVGLCQYDAVIAPQALSFDCEVEQQSGAHEHLPARER